MVCQTVKAGIDCIFMKKKGCSFNGGKCYPVVDSCEGCDKIQDYPLGRFCTSYADPGSKWKMGNCNLASHIKKETVAAQKMLNPLKASKRRA
ncbi:MAG: PxxKW family cysteine-rich protein [Pseudomonadota bacterium]